MRGLYHCLLSFCLEYLCIMSVEKQSMCLSGHLSVGQCSDSVTWTCIEGSRVALALLLCM